MTAGQDNKDDQKDSFSSKTIDYLRNWKKKYRNKSVTKWFGTALLVIIFLAHFYLFSKQTEIDIRNTSLFLYKWAIRDVAIFLLLHGWLTLILIASLFFGLINTFKVLLWFPIFIGKLFGLIWEVVVGLLPESWQKHFKPNVIRRVVVGFLTIVNALYFSMVRPKLADDTKNFFKALLTDDQFADYYISVDVLFFWIVLIVSVIFSFSHYGNEESENDKRRFNEEQKQTSILLELQRAIVKVPEKGILDSYPELYLRFKENLSGNFGTPQQLVLALQKSLACIDELSRKFMPNDKEEIKSCVNFMVYVPRTGVSDKLRTKCENLRIHYKSNYWKNRFEGYLLYEHRMSHWSDGYKPEKELSLPIFNKNSRHKNLVSGSVLAFVENDREMVYYANLAEIIDQMKARLKGRLKKEATIFFQEGYGADIESLFSIRIGLNDRQLGVLNIHSNVPNYFGGRHYTGSFLALLTPMISELEQNLDLYQKFLLPSSKN